MPAIDTIGALLGSPIIEKAIIRNTERSAVAARTISDLPVLFRALKSASAGGPIIHLAIIENPEPAPCINLIAPLTAIAIIRK